MSCVAKQVLMNNNHHNQNNIDGCMFPNVDQVLPLLWYPCILCIQSTSTCNAGYALLSLFLCKIIGKDYTLAFDYPSATAFLSICTHIIPGVGAKNHMYV